MGRVAAVGGATRAALLDVLDLALPAACAGCGVQPGLLCLSCRQLLRAPARPAWPDPTPAGLPPPCAVAAYAGAVRDIVIAHKEDGRRALAQPLGAALAASIAASVAAAPAAVAGAPAAVAGAPAADVTHRATAVPRLVLVPMPSRAAAVRTRGHDPTLAMTRRAAARLRRDGQRVTVLPVLRLAGSVTDQAGLDAVARHANLAGAVLLPSRFERVLDRLGARPGETAVVLVDDIITTGASLASAAATLRWAGAPAVCAALVAATPRRTAPGSARRPGDARAGASPGVLPGAGWD